MKTATPRNENENETSPDRRSGGDERAPSRKQQPAGGEEE